MAVSLPLKTRCVLGESRRSRGKDVDSTQRCELHELSTHFTSKARLKVRKETEKKQWPGDLAKLSSSSPSFVADLN